MNGQFLSYRFAEEIDFFVFVLGFPYMLFKPGVSNTRPARCVCAALDIFKITQIIAETTVFCIIKALLASDCGLGDIFPLNAARKPFFLLKCGPHMKLSLRPLL